jgi:hypothetical protein
MGGLGNMNFSNKLEAKIVFGSLLILIQAIRVICSIAKVTAYGVSVYKT